MKKFMRIITAAIISAGFVGSVASAATCTTDVVIDNSGNGNTTTVTCNDERTATITCTDGFVVGNYNDQEGESGSGSSEGGSVETGSVVNYNGTETTIGAACVTSTTTPTTTPTSAPTPSTTASPSPATTPVAASLPNTASNDTATIIAVSLTLAAAVVGLSRAAIAAYRHIGNK